MTETLLCFGLGYCARHYVEACGGRYARVIGTVRSRDSALALSTRCSGGPAIDALVFDGVAPSEAVVAAIDEADAVLVSVPPGPNGDPVLDAFSGALARAPRLKTIVYLSTVGVYGDHDGAPVDEATPALPVSDRGRARLAAEAAWQDVGRRGGKPVAVLRLAGIYGPGRNALENVASGRARRILKPGQVFNRIHVADIAQAIDAAIGREASGLFNVTDDEPGPPQDVIAFAAALIGCEAPPEIAFADAEGTMTPMARSFYGENKRVGNARLKQELGVSLLYPTYRDGLRALRDSGGGQRPKP